MIICRRQVFLYCRAAPAARGPSPLAVGLIESHGAGASGSPGRDARMPPGLEERAPGSAGLSAGCLRTPGDRGPGDGRQRGIIQQARVPTDGRTPRNVAVELRRSRVGRGTGGCGCPVRRALSRHYAQRRERPGRTRALPPICMAKAARWRASRQHTDSAVLRVSPGQAGCLPSRPIRAFCGRIGPSVSQVCIASIKSAARVSTCPGRRLFRGRATAQCDRLRG